MSHYDCGTCGGRFRDDHRCGQDPANVEEDLETLAIDLRDLADLVHDLEERLARLESQRQGDPHE